MRVTTAAAPLTRRLRAIKIIRVSKQGKRTTEQFISPEDQDKKCDGLALAQNWDWVAAFTELNQSGLRTKLPKRKGLYPALLMVEAGEADVIVFGFRDRMARNSLVEQEFLGRVGLAGGQVWAADFGQIKTDTAAERLTSGVLGLVQQYVAETTREKTDGPKARAVELGIAPYPVIPIGYRRHCDIHQGSNDRRIVVFEPERRLVVGAYERRAADWTLEDIRDWLRAEGVDIQIRGVQEMLKKRTYLGEMHFGKKLVNLNSHEPIISPALFRSVQGKRVARGPRTGDFRSTRLLARQGVVRCAYCKRAMNVGSQTKRDGTKYYDYRCPSMGDCTTRVAISADVLERWVENQMKQIQATGRASMDTRVVKAEAAVETTGKKYRRYLAIVGDDEDEDIEEARAKKAELRAAHEAALEQLQALRSALGSSLTVTLADWDSAGLERQRRLIRIVFDRIEISRGRGTDRIQAFLK
jgi:DNA invertase Pin-like site-specific DNA recombinase